MVVREHGSGPVVVLLHGREPIEHWFALTDVLARSYRVLLPDLRTMKGRATGEIAAMLVERGAACPRALVGASTGAYLALDLVTRAGIAPDVVIALAGVAALRGAPDLRPRLPHVAARLYARVGALDRSCPPGCSDEITRLAPRATLEIVLGCGHDLLREDGPATVAAIAREIALG
jgi:pimeloyl-ACP methyl ester carboxylesterase